MLFSGFDGRVLQSMTSTVAGVALALRTLNEIFPLAATLADGMFVTSTAA